MNATVQKLIRFGFSGAGAVLAYYVPYYLLTEMFGAKHYLMAAFAASVISSSVNFVLQKYWTFKNKEPGKAGVQAGRFIITSIVFTLTNSGLLYALVHWLHLNYMVAQMIVTVILSIASWFASSGWIFREKTQ